MILYFILLWNVFEDLNFINLYTKILITEKLLVRIYICIYNLYIRGILGIFEHGNFINMMLPITYTIYWRFSFSLWYTSLGHNLGTCDCRRQHISYIHHVIMSYIYGVPKTYFIKSGPRQITHSWYRITSHRIGFTSKLMLYNRRRKRYLKTTHVAAVAVRQYNHIMPCAVVRQLK